MNLKLENLIESPNLLVILNTDNYNSGIIKITKMLQEKTLCYITLNKTSSSLQEFLLKNKVEIKNIFFIDGITKTIQKSPPEDERTRYVSSPGALTDLAIMVSSVLKYGFDYLIIDSLNSMSIYRDQASIERFIHILITKMKENHTSSIILVIDTEDNKSLIKKCGMFVDSVVEEK